MGLETGLDAVVKRKVFQPLPGLEPPVIQPVAQRYTIEPLIYPGSCLLYVGFDLCLITVCRVQFATLLSTIKCYSYINLSFPFPGKWWVIQNFQAQI
jgi:hypothetical protein